MNSIFRPSMRWAIPLFCLAAGAAAGYMASGLADNKEAHSLMPERVQGYSFISPLVDCRGSENYVKNRELNPFKMAVEKTIQEKVEKKSAQRVAVYFRELNDGLWFSIGDIERFAPASLTKVPLMIAYLKDAENDPGLLRRKIRFPGSFDMNRVQLFRPSQVLVPGRDYTVEELLVRMIIYSDNNSQALLESSANIRTLGRVFDDLGLPSAYRAANNDYISAQEYSRIFRTLYNATYLQREKSEEVLELLTRTEFASGLVAGVPASVPVAHKFGERQFPGSETKELHDCGIIYYTHHPYILCVMSTGDNYETLDDAIASISRVIYESVDRQHKGDH